MINKPLLLSIRTLIERGGLLAAADQTAADT
jgi:hypothetical protein